MVLCLKPGVKSSILVGGSYNPYHHCLQAITRNRHLLTKASGAANCQLGSNSMSVPEGHTAQHTIRNTLCQREVLLVNYLLTWDITCCKPTSLIWDSGEDVTLFTHNWFIMCSQWVCPHIERGLFLSSVASLGKEVHIGHYYWLVMDWYFLKCFGEVKFLWFVLLFWMK